MNNPWSGFGLPLTKEAGLYFVWTTAGISFEQQEAYPQAGYG
jgi:hypothetical protein